MVSRRRKRPEASALLPLFGVCLLSSVTPALAPSSFSSERRLAQLSEVVTEKAAASVQQESYSPPPEATASVPLHYSSGTHHVHVYIGSPPQRQTLIVDTGSRLMAFPCKPCSNCGKHASEQFDPSISTTDVVPRCGGCFLKDISTCSEYDEKCRITQKYTEGSTWTAIETEDIVWFGTANHEESVESFMKLAVPYVFGCQKQETGLFTGQYADGILGLANHETSIIRTLHEAGSIGRYAFSLCLTKTGGHLSLGGSLSGKHLERMRFSPMTIHSDYDQWYSLMVLEVRVGDVCVACPSTESPSLRGTKNALSAFARGKGTILDSGTTDTFLPKALADPFAKAWKQVTGGMNVLARSRYYSYVEFQRLPRISFLFASNVTLVLDPTYYMEGAASEAWFGRRKLTNRVYLDEKDGAVLGANAMVGYDILYDIEARRVGIARADCSNSDAI